MTSNIPASVSPRSLQESKLQSAIAAYREKMAASSKSKLLAAPTIESIIPTIDAKPQAELYGSLNSSNDSIANATDKHGHSITYNSRQTEFIKLASTGQSCILIGAAGTGKTTSQKGAILSMLSNGLLPPIQGITHKHLSNGSPGIAIVAFTRRATNNIRKNLSDDLQANCLTIHKLLEYEPVYSEIFDEETGRDRKTMRFEPTRNESNPLPESIRCVVIEESSMVSVELFRQLRDALPHEPQYIFLGDIQQLPPVFGSAILGFKMLELPTIELTEVYRQALDSPIISLAHRILSGNPIPVGEYKTLSIPGKLTIHPWIKRISADNATLTLAKFFIKALSDGKYNPETDAILIPFNKSCGTNELNNHIANSIAQINSRPVYEIVHGWQRSYYSIGDKCLYDKEDCIVTNIYRNPEYSGVDPREESIHMDYWGNRKHLGNNDESTTGESTDEIDILLQNVAGSDNSDSEDRVRVASHSVTLQMLDSEREITIKNAGELNNLSLGYSITVHKSQGSEFEKVFLCLHQSHATMLQRELLYTAVTRAKKELFIICESDSFTKGILNQRIKGNTLAEKAVYFQGKIDNKEMQS